MTWRSLSIMRSKKIAVLGVASAAAVAFAYRKRRSTAADIPALSNTSRTARTAEMAKIGAQTSATYVAHQARRSIASDEKKVELDKAYELK